MENNIKELLTLDRFIDWLKTKPADEPYNYSDARAHGEHKGCAITQFLTENGVEDVSVDPFTVFWTTGAGIRERIDLPHELDRISISNTTFGGALKTAL